MQTIPPTKPVAESFLIIVLGSLNNTFADRMAQTAHFSLMLQQDTYSCDRLRFRFHFPHSGAVPCAICFYLEMHKLQHAGAIITASPVLSRSPVLLADDTSGIVRSIPKTVTITAYKSDFHALQTIIIK